eukprot:g7861.t1
MKQEVWSRTPILRCLFLRSLSGPLLRLLASCNAWVLQESPTLVAACLSWLFGSQACRSSPGNLAVLLCFVVHYVNRSFVYPLQMKGSKPFPLPVMMMAMTFCAVNGYIQCQSLMRYLLIPVNWMTCLGICIWMTGLCPHGLIPYPSGGGWIGRYINVDADQRLRNLRKPGETGCACAAG